MGGFFGVASANDCVCDLFYGTDYHSHLGTRRGGLAVSDGTGTFHRRIHDITNAQFRSKFDDDIIKFRGKTGIGVISDGEDQPLVISSSFGNFALVTVGRINNMEEITHRSINEHHVHFSELSRGEYNPTEVVASLINTAPTLEKGIEKAMNCIDGSCSMLIMANNAIYAVRDKYGRTPVVIGKRHGAYCAAMESTALPNLDYTLDRELGPGEIVKITEDAIVQVKEPEETMQICSFFWVYFGYPSSNYEGKNTETVRYRNGALIAAEDQNLDIDSVCGIPDSGVAHAIGYSNASDTPYQRALVKYTPTWPRSFTPTNQAMRDLFAKMKLLPVEGQIEGKKLLFCDDSIVRGTQFKNIAKRLYEFGAKEVHMRSASPPLMFPCLFLNFSRSKSALDLIARRIINTLEGGEPDEVALQEYTTAGTPRYNRMVEEIRKSLGLTTLKYQSMEKLVEAIGLPKEKICTYCFDGCNPVKCKNCPCEK